MKINYILFIIMKPFELIYSYIKNKIAGSALLLNHFIMSINMGLIVLSVCILAGCATMDSLPATPSEVYKFEEGRWPRQKHRACIFLKGETFEHIFKISKISLISNDYKILREDISKGVVIGRHRFSWSSDGHVMAGIYVTRIKQEIQLNILSAGIADPSVIPLIRHDWSGKVLNTILSASSSDTEACSRSIKKSLELDYPQTEAFSQVRHKVISNHPMYKILKI